MNRKCNKSQRIYRRRSSKPKQEKKFPGNKRNKKKPKFNEKQLSLPFSFENIVMKYTKAPELDLQLRQKE